jgi:hypothetical protein
METIEHFARISLVARFLGRERLLSREEVDRLQGLFGSYGVASRPAEFCAEGAEADDANCQIIQAPSSPNARLVHDETNLKKSDEIGKENEIRLTYRELTALIEDAVKAVKPS